MRGIRAGTDKQGSRMCHAPVIVEMLVEGGDYKYSRNNGGQCALGAKRFCNTLKTLVV